MNTFKRYAQQTQEPYKIIQTNQGKFAILKPMIAPIHVAEEYYRQIMPLIKAMIDDYIDIVNKYYNNGIGELTIDAKPSHYMQDFRKALLATAVKWNKIS